MSSTTYGYNHRDIHNFLLAWCAVIAGGPFPYTEGGQLVLHEYKLIVELQPGQMCLFPSALITHCNIPIPKGKQRFSLTLYSPGGLYRYVAYGCRTWKVFQKEDAKGAKEFVASYLKNWNSYWDQASTLSSLDEFWTNAL